MKIWLICLLFALSTPAIGQIVKIMDVKNRPISNVAVFNEQKTISTLSDDQGIVKLDPFSDQSILLFQHPSYQDYLIVKSQIQNGIVILKDQVFNMDNVVISANKWEQDISEIPNIILSLESDVIENNNPQTAADLLSSSGEVFVQKSQLGGGSPKLRGFSANSTLIVVDGVRMNNAIYRSGNLQNIISIDPNILEGTEVIMGPGSVIYGSDALGGVMDFHTKDLTFKKVTSGSALARYSSANRERTGHVDITLGSNKLSSLSSFTYSSFSDLLTGNNRNDSYPDFGKRRIFAGQDATGDDVLIDNNDINKQVESGFDSWNIVQKLGFRPSEKVELTYSFYLSNTSDIPRYDRLIEPGDEGLAAAEWFYGPQKWLMHSVKAEVKSRTHFFDQARIVAAFQDYEESRNDRDFGDDRLRTRTEEVDIYSLNLDFDKGVKKDHSLFYGIEFLYNDVNSSGIRKNIKTGEVSTTSPRYPDEGSQYYSGSAYASYIHRLPKFVLSSGVRFTYVGLEARTSDPEASFINSDRVNLDNSAINGSVGVVYRGIKNQKISWMISSGFRAPNIDDVGKVFELNENSIIVPNQSLKPEYSYNTELSWSGAFRSLSWRITGFFTFLDNAIVRGNFAVNGRDSVAVDGINRRVFAQTNASEAVIFGGSLDLNYSISNNLKTRLTLTETAGEERSSKEPLRHTTPVFGRLSIIYELSKFRLEAYSNFNGNRFRNDIPMAEIDSKPYLYAQHINNDSKDGSPGWVTANIQTKYKLSKNFQMTAAVENLLNTHYRPYSSGISAPGRNVIIGLRGSF